MTSTNAVSDRQPNKEAARVAAQLAYCSRHDIEDLVDRSCAQDALITIAGKAELLRVALESIDSTGREMTISLQKGVTEVLGEISDAAWNVARVQFHPEWESKYGERQNIE